MPNLSGVSPVGRDEGGCSYAARMVDGSGAGFGDVEGSRRQDVGELGMSTQGSRAAWCRAIRHDMRDAADAGRGCT